MNHEAKLVHILDCSTLLSGDVLHAHGTLFVIIGKCMDYDLSAAGRYKVLWIFNDDPWIGNWIVTKTSDTVLR